VSTLNRLASSQFELYFRNILPAILQMFLWAKKACNSKSRKTTSSAPSPPCSIWLVRTCGEKGAFATVKLSCISETG